MPIKATTISRGTPFSYSYLFLICGTILAHALGWAEIYRIFAYSQMLIAIWMIYEGIKSKTLSMGHVTLWAVPLLLIALHMLVMGDMHFTKEIRHILIALSLSCSIWLLTTQTNISAKAISYSALIAISVYLVIQCICLLAFKWPYGSTRNPHYLAQYSVLFLLTCGYLWTLASHKIKLLLAIQILILLIIILFTSSRPAWIALGISGGIVLWGLPKKQKLGFAAFIVALVVILFITNLEHFSQRVLDLYKHIGTEERVYIWHDAWQLQLTSTGLGWLFGHGLDGFAESFKAFSSYHLLGIDFNSPHNFFLELLYLNGLAGLSLVILFFGVTYAKLSKLYLSNINRSLAVLLIAALTANLFFVAITLPFYTSYNVNIIAIVIGVMLYLDSSKAKLQANKK